MSNRRPFRGMLSASPLRGHHDLDAVFWCPAFEGLPHRLWDSLGALCLHDANSLALEKLAGTPLRADLHLGIFAGDPFHPPADTARLLRKMGVSAVFNMPSVGAFDAETAATLDEVGLGLQNEIACLSEFEAAGFTTTAFVRDSSSASLAVKLGIKRIVIHPGPPVSSLDKPVPVQNWIGRFLHTASDSSIQKLLYIGSDSQEVSGLDLYELDGIVFQESA